MVYLTYQIHPNTVSLFTLHLSSNKFSMYLVASMPLEMWNVILGLVSEFLVQQISVGEGMKRQMHFHMGRKMGIWHCIYLLLMITAALIRLGHCSHIIWYHFTRQHVKFLCSTMILACTYLPSTKKMCPSFVAFEHCKSELHWAVVYVASQHIYR